MQDQDQRMSRSLTNLLTLFADKFLARPVLYSMQRADARLSFDEIYDVNGYAQGDVAENNALSMSSGTGVRGFLSMNKEVPPKRVTTVLARSLWREEIP